jgi:hypothetical protein
MKDPPAGVEMIGARTLAEAIELALVKGSAH